MFFFQPGGMEFKAAQTTVDGCFFARLDPSSTNALIHQSTHPMANAWKILRIHM